MLIMISVILSHPFVVSFPLDLRHGSEDIFNGFEDPAAADPEVNVPGSGVSLFLPGNRVDDISGHPAYVVVVSILIHLPGA